MTYRINYGNGQVGPTKKTYSEARNELVSYRHMDYSNFYRIERYDGRGEWIGLGKAGRLATSTCDGL